MLQYFLQINLKDRYLSLSRYSRQNFPLFGHLENLFFSPPSLTRYCRHVTDTFRMVFQVWEESK